MKNLYGFLLLFFFVVELPAQEQAYFKNFVYHLNGTLCNHTAPDASFMAFINGDEDQILIENAPRWALGGDPNINGHGLFGVELGNFFDPPVQIGDSAFARFFCSATGQQGIIADYVTALPWVRFPLQLHMISGFIPPPANVTLTMDSVSGDRHLAWSPQSNVTFKVYRRNYNEILPDGTKRKVYHLIASNLAAAGFIDTTSELSQGYGYIIFAEDAQGLLSPHSEEVNEDPPEGWDLTIGYIARLPRIDYVWGSTQPWIEGWPAAGQSVTWQASVKNWTTNTLNVPYRWFMDGILADSGIAIMPPETTSVINYPWNWTFERHELKLVLDPNNLIVEEEENNNELLIYTNAIGAGFYVEQSVYDYFKQYQKLLNVHSNCWEDWAQRHIKRWNEMFANAIFPETPFGVLDRIRLDCITVVPDNALPLHGGLASNNPNLLDRTIDLQWGFAVDILNGTFYSNHTSPSDNNPFYFEGSLMHELGHARYLIDAYGFSVDDDGNGSTVAIMENGNFIGGTPYMPFVGGLVYSTPIKGLMNSQYTWVDHYSAVALNLIAGHRAVEGNYNAPNNIGVFVQDLPEQNQITLKDGAGNILSNANVKVYQSTGKAGVWYGKFYDNTPDLEFNADAQGKFLIGKCPFDNDGTIEHDYGKSNFVIILRVEHNGKIGYGFLEASAFNFEYWRGDTLLGEHEFTVDLIDPVSIDEEKSLITDFSLSQNYPNPFNPATVIHYEVPERSHISLKLYDILGNEIAALVDEVKEQGRYSFSFDASLYNLSSGVYIYNLKAGPVSINRKMMLLR